LYLQEKPRRPPALVDDGSDDDSMGGEVKPEKSIVPSSSSQKGKQPVSNKEIKKPSQHTVATWRRGDDDMEPSAKMLALIEQLSIAENAGDKTIVYSQCPSPFLSICLQLLTMMRARTRNRDVNAGLDRNVVHAIRHPGFAVRWEDAERGARGGAHRVPQDRRAQGHSDQHQMRRRRVKPHLRQPSCEVRPTRASLLSARVMFVLTLSFSF
jgi:hypothetical protein